MIERVTFMANRLAAHLKDREKRKILLIRIVNWVYFTKVSASFMARRFVRHVLKALLPRSGFEKVISYLIDARARYFDVAPGVRWYLKKEYDVELFFRKLKDSDVDYVVLRWFEDLPNVKPNEDVDILVTDESLSTLRSFCVAYNNGCQTLDVYSVTGIDGSGFEETSYYPPRLAEKILRSKHAHKGLYYVPGDHEHFMSLAYHAVFHKGHASGLDNQTANTASDRPDHDYAVILRAMAEKIGLEDVDLSFRGLYAFLKDQDWSPEMDTLRFFARKDPWLRELTSESGRTKRTEKGELIVFIIRSWAAENEKLDFIKTALKINRLDVLRFVRLDPASLVRTKDSVRGGQWGHGPYPVSGGDPYAIVICFDYSPVSPSNQEHQIYPHLSNSNILIKHRIRDKINRDLIYKKHANFLHSADNEEEAWEYLNVAVPELMDEIKAQVQRVRNSDYFHRRKVLRTFVANGTRAKTELIECTRGLCVLKSYKPGRERFLEREAFVYGTLSKKINTIPQLVEKGNSHIVTEYFENILEEKSEKEKRTIIRQYTYEIVSTMRLFYDQGYAILGFYPGNLIVTRKGELKVIDFEFLHRYENVPPQFSESYDVVGVPADFAGDMPVSDCNHTIMNTWSDYLDMPKAHRLIHSWSSKMSSSG